MEGWTPGKIGQYRNRCLVYRSVSSRRIYWSTLLYLSCFRGLLKTLNDTNIHSNEIMANWTAEKSTILSLMLDKVSGTEEIIAIRQDFCRMHDCMESCALNVGFYFTGSKAEGLDLPDSDRDYMWDINEALNIRVAQTQETSVASSPRSASLLLCTDNVHPGFVLLRWLSNSPLIRHPILLRASQIMKGFLHLSSFLFTREILQFYNESLNSSITHVIQGPSLEFWGEYSDRSASGTDSVLSIHCPFWPRGAEEWLHRPRRCGWPTPTDITQITGFGCHLVAIGYPLSSSKEMEWRMSFSIAERILVWSFNHVQIQCYAVMKIILKEFIKVRCSPQNYVLCSYFIKTFLFWKFEVTESTFWRAENFRDCIRFLFVEFTKCIRDRELPHYFFPSFNLLSVKLTREAQRELLQILDTAKEHDVSILRECNTLRDVWSQFIGTDGNINRVKHMMKKTNLVRNDECMMDYAYHCYFLYNDTFRHSLDPSRVTRAITQLITGIFAGRYTTSLAPLVLRYHLFMSNIPSRVQGNRDAYKLRRLAHSDAASVDVSTCKLWYAMVLLMRTDYAACLTTVNDVLSRIPPFALYTSDGTILSSRESTSLYEHVYLQSDADVVERLRTAWLTDLRFYKQNINLPSAVREELSYDEGLGVFVSPFVFAYYLMFMCHHELHQFEDRDRALRLLVDSLYNPEQCGSYNSINIAGYCLLLAGRRDRAREMFVTSYQTTQGSFDHKFNSAVKYLQKIQWWHCYLSCRWKESTQGNGPNS